MVDGALPSGLEIPEGESGARRSWTEDDDRELPTALGAQVLALAKIKRWRQRPRRLERAASQRRRMEKFSVRSSCRRSWRRSRKRRNACLAQESEGKPREPNSARRSARRDSRRTDKQSVAKQSLLTTTIAAIAALAVQRKDADKEARTAGRP